MSMSVLRLEEYAGQHCDVVARIRHDGSVFVTFESRRGYGNPTLDESDLRCLLRRIANFKKAMADI